MNPLINAYNYKINQLAQQISFIQKQNIILEAVIDQADGGGGFNYPEGQLIAQMPGGFNYPEGELIAQMPDGSGNSPWTFPGGHQFTPFSRRAKFLQELYDSLRGASGRVQKDFLDEWFKLLQTLKNMDTEYLDDLIEYIRRNHMPPDLSDPFFGPIYWIRKIVEDERIINIIQPGFLGRLTRGALKWVARHPYRFAGIIIAIIIAGWARYTYADGTRVFNSEEEFLQWLENWVEQNEGNPNPEPPELPTGPNGQEPPDLDIPDFNPVSPSTAPEIPSMLPPSNPSTTAPQLPGGGGGGLGARPIDPTQMGM